MLHGVIWKDLNEETKQELLSNANIWDDIKEGECIIDLTEKFSVEGEIVDGEIIIKDNGVIYNPEIGKPE
ncbi:MAG: hypothetical protein SPF22_05495 [Candidatus Onthovivens sp.]|nr:hypothetical protein [Candidatus Onthovivens sp.]